MRKIFFTLLLISMTICGLAQKSKPKVEVKFVESRLNFKNPTNAELSDVLHYINDMGLKGWKLKFVAYYYPGDLEDSTVVPKTPVDTTIAHIRFERLRKQKK